MRVSTSMMYTDFTRNINRNSSKLQKYQNQLSTLNEYSKSSDNPIEFAKIINLTDQISQNKYFNETINDAISWSNSQDGALSNASDSFHRIRQLITSSATGTQGSEEMEANKKEIMSEIEGIVDALNTNFDGRYIFGGQNTKQAPFEVVKNDKGELVEIKYHGTDSKDGQVKTNLGREISKGVTIDLITDGNLFINEKGTDADPDNLSSFFNEVITAINDGDQDALSGPLLEKVSIHSENFVNVRSQIGTLSNRLSAAKDRNEMESLNLKQVLSNKQDVDIAEKYMNFSKELISYQASLSMGTKILQTSILDYV
ncbi:flagellar hook-associated protein FlgL [Vagococcus silagei]|uniref:Flagellar hook-associated protein 3 n=1 Tax=Vagococcus silagei TaxID=2508885 RepID=A0A4S3B5Z9_9ENTE|nr:flagellar hook-associated protein FlgL [Vagococcus silagei]THB61310.1 flagellar hook-associated protein 3 [Vagococcus silagei]